MKVKLGPFPRQLTAQGVAETILFFLDEEHALVDWLGDRLMHPTLLWLMESYNDWRGDRRVQVRIDPWDSWNADHTLALIALPLLVQLRDTKHGSPIVDDKDVPEHLRNGQNSNDYKFELEGDERVEQLTHKKWEWVLDEIIWALTQVTDEGHEDQFYHWGDKDPDLQQEGVQAMLDRMQVDREGLEAHNRRIDRGLRLLGRYWRALWD